MWDFLGNVMGAQRLLREAWSASRVPVPNALSSDSRVSESTVMLGETTVFIETETSYASGPIYVNLHENEQTSVLAARAVLAETGAGRIVRLRSKGRRYVIFWDGSRPFAFDPNRIFSDEGIRQTLSRYASLTDPALQALRLLRATVLDRLCAPNGQPVVALHNNSGTDYSVSEYRAGGRHAKDAAAITVGSTYPPEDFFVVTEHSWFRGLERRGFNVVLQGPGAIDDGSLSVWFQRNGRSYINVEARHGSLAAQQLMLRAIAEELSSSCGRPTSPPCS